MLHLAALTTLTDAKVQDLTINGTMGHVSQGTSENVAVRDVYTRWSNVNKSCAYARKQESESISVNLVQIRQGAQQHNISWLAGMIHHPLRPARSHEQKRLWLFRQNSDNQQAAHPKAQIVL